MFPGDPPYVVANWVRPSPTAQAKSDAYLKSVMHSVFTEENRLQPKTRTHLVRVQPGRLFVSSFSKTQSLPRQERCGQLLLGLEPISAGRCWCARPGAKSTSTRRTESSHAKNRKGAAKKIDEIRLKSSWIAPKLCTAIRNEDKKLLQGDHCSI